MLIPIFFHSFFVNNPSNNEYFGIYDTNNCTNNSDFSIMENDSPCMQDECIDMEITRLSFAPVLKQLKRKISPIQTQMKEREMQFLLSKGIDREKIINFDKTEENQIQTQMLDEETSTPLKPKTKQPGDRYEETRSFLQQKQTFMIIPANHLPSQTYEEDIYF